MLSPLRGAPRGLGPALGARPLRHRAGADGADVRAGLAQHAASRRRRVLAAGLVRRFAATDTLAFTAQMALILVAGSTLARAPLVRAAARRWLAARPQHDGAGRCAHGRRRDAGSACSTGASASSWARCWRAQIGARFSARGPQAGLPARRGRAGFVGLHRVARRARRAARRSRWPRPGRWACRCRSTRRSSRRSTS